ncbi:MAG: hypothetical protein ACLP2P_16735 [Desulfobaccales bacterium]
MTQKQTSAQTTAARMSHLDQRLGEIFQAESKLLRLKKEVEAAL